MLVAWLFLIDCKWLLFINWNCFQNQFELTELYPNIFCLNMLVAWYHSIYPKLVKWPRWPYRCKMHGSQFPEYKATELIYFTLPHKSYWLLIFTRKEFDLNWFDLSIGICSKLILINQTLSNLFQIENATVAWYLSIYLKLGKLPRWPYRRCKMQGSEFPEYKAITEWYV